MIGKGTSYWRIKTSGRHLNTTSSEVRSFVIENITIGQNEPGYTVKHDPASYPATDGVNIENLWIRSIKDPFKNITFENNGSQDRSMVAVGDYVYITHRTENAVGAVLSLEKYDGYTGEHLGSIKLGNEANVAYFPLNNLVKDDNDNLVISNLTLNIAGTPVYVHHVDPITGNLTELACIDLKDAGITEGRVDHLSVSGDVSTGNFNIYIAIASRDQVARVKYVNGKKVDTKVARFSSFAPQTARTSALRPLPIPSPRTRSLSTAAVSTSVDTTSLPVDLSTRSTTTPRLQTPRQRPTVH